MDCLFQKWSGTGLANQTDGGAAVAGSPAREALLSAVRATVDYSPGSGDGVRLDLDRFQSGFTKCAAANYQMVCVVIGQVTRVESRVGKHLSRLERRSQTRRRNDVGQQRRRMRHLRRLLMRLAYRKPGGGRGGVKVWCMQI